MNTILKRCYYIYRGEITSVSTIDQPNPLYASQVSHVTSFDYNNAATVHTRVIVIIYCGFRKLSLICHLKKLMWRQLHEFQGSPQNHKYISLAFPFSLFTPPSLSLPSPMLSSPFPLFRSTSSSPHIRNTQ